MNDGLKSNNYHPWGKSIALDLYDCNHSKMFDPEGLKQFISNLIKAVDMVAHGPCHVDRFGDGKLLGYSAMQFIKTSAITVHLDETKNRAFIDLFSCKDFESRKVLQLALHYFEASSHKLVELDR